MKRQRWTPEELLSWLKTHKKTAPFTSQDLVRQFKMSRQTAARLLHNLVNDNKLSKTGSTQAARYHVAKGTKPKKLRLKKRLPGLEEDRVFDNVSLRLLLKRSVSENVSRIAYYAFCEMLNNAIDHSQSKLASIDVGLLGGSFQFWIRDQGVGIFQNIRRGFHLNSDEEAIEHLLKGKQTTAPAAHTGQGIFFTSKIADRFELRSGKFKLSIDNLRKDVQLAQMRPIQGTLVHFTIKAHSRKSLAALFESFANEDFEFDRTKYPVVLLQQGGVISRSQARRLTTGLEKFDRVIFDFTQVKELGQGFADEIFRVYQTKNPQIILEVQNANSAVHFMIQRASLKAVQGSPGK